MPTTLMAPLGECDGSVCTLAANSLRCMNESTITVTTFDAVNEICCAVVIPV